MFTRSSAVLAFALIMLTAAATADGNSPGRGQPISPQDLGEWDISVFPSGQGLPPGSGTAAKGAEIFTAKCAACHGDQGQGGLAPALISGRKREGIDESTVTIANFWPYATTVFDYVRRAMPWQSPRSLSDEEAYALTAFILARNLLIPDGEVIDARTLPNVKMPNRDGFIAKFPKITPPMQPSP
jgi:cytochrome c